MYYVVKCWSDGNGGDFSYNAVIGVVDGDGAGGFDGARGVFRYYEEGTVIEARGGWVARCHVQEDCVDGGGGDVEDPPVRCEWDTVWAWGGVARAQHARLGVIGGRRSREEVIGDGVFVEVEVVVDV